MPISRRNLVAATTAGLGFVGSAHAATPEEALSALRGSVRGDTVTLPPIGAPTQNNPPTPNADPVQKRLGVAVVGLGHLSLDQILPGFGQSRHMRLTALVSGERDKARAVAAQHGVAESHIYDYGNFDRLKDNPDVDVIYIVLPNNMHAEYTVRAAQAGKHVLCEKPMATSVADAQRMIDACRQAQRQLMIAYRCQYAPEHLALIEMAQKRTMGRVRLIEAVNGQNNADDGQWRHIKAMAGGGSLPDVGIYCLNAARYLTGEEPFEVMARVTRPKDDNRFREVEDICSFTLGFPSGVVANCTAGYSFHENRQLRVMADDGWFGMDPAFGYDNLAVFSQRKSGETDAQEQRRFAPMNQFAREMDAFADAIRSGKPVRTPGEEGLRDLRLIEAIYRAAENGGVVKLS